MTSFKAWLKLLTWGKLCNNWLHLFHALIGKAHKQLLFTVTFLKVRTKAAVSCRQHSLRLTVELQQNIQAAAAAAEDDQGRRRRSLPCSKLACETEDSNSDLVLEQSARALAFRDEKKRSWTTGARGQTAIVGRKKSRTAEEAGLNSQRWTSCGGEKKS